MRKEKLRKVVFCFITGHFIKSFKMIINHFFLFCKKNIYFKNNSNLLVMKVTIKFSADKMWIYDTLLKLIIVEVRCL